MDFQTLKMGIQRKIWCLLGFGVDEQDIRGSVMAAIKAKHSKTLLTALDNFQRQVFMDTKYLN